MLSAADAAQPATFVVQFFCKKLQTYFSYWLRIAVTLQEYLRKGCGICGVPTILFIKT